MVRWQIITGEYPPQFGGVSDYTRLIARGLVAAGDEVTIWAPPVVHTLPSEDADDVRVRRLPDCFGPNSLRELSRGIDSDARILVQYVPHAYGMKAMNVPLCLWLYGQRRRDLSVMFHEVAYPLRRGQALDRNALGLVHRAMAATVARAARRIFIAAEAWRNRLRSYALGPRPIMWVPVPSNIPMVDDRAAVTSCRARYAERGESLIGHFGNYGTELSAILQAALLPILQSGQRLKLLMIGRNSERFSASLAASSPNIADRMRVHATGTLDQRAASIAISACDLMVQPYPDGITTRNASAIAGLAHAKPIVTNVGELTEKLWLNSSAALVIRKGDVSGLGIAALELASDRERLRRMGCAAAVLYRDVFDIGHTIRALRET